MVHRDDPVSTTHQMYLKTLFRLTQTRPVGRVRDVARELGVTPGTASLALMKLKDLRLVEGERYGGVLLTPAGEAVARCVNHRFETLRALLVEVFGLSPETADADACSMEHAVSPETVDRAEALLAQLRAGESLELKNLGRLGDGVPSRCADCAAAGVCLASSRVTARRASGRNAGAEMKG